MKSIETEKLILTLLKKFKKKYNVNSKDFSLEFIQNNFFLTKSLLFVIQKLLKLKKKTLKDHNEVLQKIFEDLLKFEKKYFNFDSLIKTKILNFLNDDLFTNQSNFFILREKKIKFDKTNLTSEQIEEINLTAIFIGNIFSFLWNDFLNEEKNPSLKKSKMKLAYFFGYHLGALLLIFKKYIQKKEQKIKFIFPILYFVLQYIENLRLLLPLKFNYLVIQINRLCF